MTPKQTAILDTALKLFAQQGFSATPTSQIAKQAGVSEGLIFRHFTNKDGLLNSVLQIGAEGFNKKYAEIAAAGDAKAVL
ncbi:MAG: helix-turn-helix domain-containing protein, partial [Bacteroidota bacterium]